MFCLFALTVVKLRIFSMTLLDLTKSRKGLLSVGTFIKIVDRWQKLHVVLKSQSYQKTGNARLCALHRISDGNYRNITYFCSISEDWSRNWSFWWNWKEIQMDIYSCITWNSFKCVPVSCAQTITWIRLMVWLSKWHNIVVCSLLHT